MKYVYSFLYDSLGHWKLLCDKVVDWYFVNWRWKSMQVIQIVQDIEYNALKTILEFCYKNNLKCYLRGGSVLGAVKYNDFVPWDDDVDIALPRKDYEKLISIAPYELGSDLIFVSNKNTKNTHCYFPRILLKDTARVKMNLPKNNERGLCLIDVLPLDGMPNGKLKLKIHILKAYIYRILASLWTLDVKSTVSMHGKKDIILKALHALGIHRLYKQNDIYKKMDKLYSKYEFRKTKKSGMIASSKLQKEIVPSSWWGNGRMCYFRDLKVRIPSNYDQYLKQLFGSNYATYEPPKSERTKSHLKGRC